MACPLLWAAITGGKIIWQKASLPPHTNDSIVYSSGGANVNFHLIGLHASLGQRPPSTYPKRHLYRFSRFCRAYTIVTDRPTDRQTTLLQSWTWVAFWNLTQSSCTQPNPRTFLPDPTLPNTDTRQFTNNVSQQLHIERKQDILLHFVSETGLTIKCLSRLISYMVTNILTLRITSLHKDRNRWSLIKSNSTHKKLKFSTQSNPFQPNPTRGWTNPRPNLCYTVCSNRPKKTNQA